MIFDGGFNRQGKPTNPEFRRQFAGGVVMMKQSRNAEGNCYHDNAMGQPAFFPNPATYPKGGYFIGEEVFEYPEEAPKPKSGVDAEVKPQRGERRTRLVNGQLKQFEAKEVSGKQQWVEVDDGETVQQNEESGSGVSGIVDLASGETAPGNGDTGGAENPDGEEAGSAEQQ